MKIYNSTIVFVVLLLVIISCDRKSSNQAETPATYKQKQERQLHIGNSVRYKHTDRNRHDLSYKTNYMNYTHVQCSNVEGKSVEKLIGTFIADLDLACMNDYEYAYVIQTNRIGIAFRTSMEKWSNEDWQALKYLLQQGNTQACKGFISSLYGFMRFARHIDKEEIVFCTEKIMNIACSLPDEIFGNRLLYMASAITQESKLYDEMRKIADICVNRMDNGKGYEKSLYIETCNYIAYSYAFQSKYDQADNSLVLMKKRIENPTPKEINDINIVAASICFVKGSGKERQIEGRKRLIKLATINDLTVGQRHTVEFLLKLTKDNVRILNANK